MAKTHKDDSDDIIRGEFEVFTEPKRNDPLQALVETLRRAPGSRHNAIATVHREAVQALARLYIPRLDVSPSPDQFRDMADFLTHWAKIADRVLKIVGEEAKANSCENVNVGLFDGQFQSTIDGYALFELEKCAEGLQAEYDEYEGFDPDYDYEDRRAAD
jgi:hypothetical protein